MVKELVCLKLWNKHMSAIALLLTFLLMTGCGKTEEISLTPPVEPEHVLKTMELADDNLEIELFVSEPLIKDPVAMEIDEKGRMYVVEMPGYPLDTDGSGRIKLLRDTNGDGYPDEATLFAKDLMLPNGIMRWKNGVLVTDAPDIIYLEDSTGDGIADIRETILTGFANTNPQSRINNPIYGLDNWIYLAHRGFVRTETFADIFGDEGEQIRYVNQSDGTVLPQNANGLNVRIRPDSFELEALSSSSQFGHDFDAWGNHFLISNAHHNFHEAIASQYIERNSELPVRQAMHYTPVHGNAAEIYPITDNPEHQLLTDIGVMTSASGMKYYLGGLFGEKYENVTFIAESVHNLVHADKIEEDGAVFKSKRLVENMEFLASTDAWFRPVNFYIGPDGALYVIDYYRRIIEHPQWMDDETIQNEDLYTGIDRGRIFRIAPVDADKANWLDNIDLENASVEELTSALDNQNIWWRRTAQRLLVDRQNSTSVEHLENVLSDGSAEGRIHALWTLDGLGSLQISHIKTALEDNEAGIRVNAIKLAELRLNQEPSLLENLLLMKNDPSPRVRYQLLLTLGDFEQPSVREVRDELLFGEIEDEWFQIAALTAPSVRGIELFDQAINQLTDLETAGRRNYFRRIGELITAGNSEGEIRQVVRRSVGQFSPDSAWWQSATIQGVANQIQRMNFGSALLASERELLLSSFLGYEDPEFRNGVLRMLEIAGLDANESTQQILLEAENIATNTQVTEELRVDALRLLSLANPDLYKEMLFELIRPGEVTVVQREALSLLAKVSGDEVGDFVLSQWDAMTPQVRDRAVDVLMTDRSRVNMLLDAVEENQILVSTIGWNRRVILMRDWDGDVRDRARELLSEDPAARQQAIAEYMDILELQGNIDRGRQIYDKICSACHLINDERGIAFGPDLGTVRHWTPESLLSKILDPNRAIADGFEMWVIERNNAATVSGVIFEETTHSITLKNAGGNETTVLRSDIKSINATNTSAMPGGLEQQIDKQEMADLIEYIRRGGG